jgi:hypothetical protein
VADPERETLHATTLQPCIDLTPCCCCCRQACAVMVRLAAVDGLAGCSVDQLRGLKEVVNAHSTYGCLPGEDLAMVYKEQGATIVASAMSKSDSTEEERQVRLVARGGK